MNPIKSLYFKFKVAGIVRSKRFPISSVNPRCFIFLAADYGNLGDVAITYAQKKFLQEHFPDHEVVEVPAGNTLSYINSIRKQVSENDIVTVVGGGNMGDMYGDIELLRLMVVKKFKDYRIILFPQTIDYSDTKEAQWLKRFSQKVYSKARRLTMCAREKTSFEKMRVLYPDVDVRLTPDIVMGLDKVQNCDREDIATFCIRHDKEKADNDHLVSQLIEECKNIGLKIESYDTHIGGDRYSEDEKYAELGKIWRLFGRSRLVITDRLHGMIFAFITGTPAIVLPNSNFKVAGCYEWIKQCGYIKLISNSIQKEEIRTLIKDIIACKSRKEDFQKVHKQIIDSMRIL